MEFKADTKNEFNQKVLEAYNKNQTKFSDEKFIFEIVSVRKSYKTFYFEVNQYERENKRPFLKLT